MQNKNPFSLIYKVLAAFILLFVVLFASFNEGNIRSARAQEAATNTPISPLDEVPLYPGLQWDDLGPESRIVSVSNEGNDVELSGRSYLSQQIMGKPNQDMRYYYSAESLAKFGWQFVTDSIGMEAETATYFKTGSQYLVVEFRSCDNKIPSESTCIKVWITSPDSRVSSPTISTLVPLSGLTEVGTVLYSNPLPVPTLSQNDATWKADRLGFPDAGYPTACDFSTIGGYGCFVTSYAMLYDYYRSGNTDPKNLNNNLNTGLVHYLSNGQHCNNFMPGGAPYAPAGVSRGSTYKNYCTQNNCVDSSNVSIIQNEINAGRPLLAVVHSSKAPNGHMVVITGYSGSTYYINDSWDGGRHTLASTTGLGPYVLDEIRLFNGMPPKPGDANGDGRVDGLDYVIWLNNYGKPVSGGSSGGDFNGDGKVDGLDYVIWLNNYGK